MTKGLLSHASWRILPPQVLPHIVQQLHGLRGDVRLDYIALQIQKIVHIPTSDGEIIHVVHTMITSLAKFTCHCECVVDTTYDYQTLNPCMIASQAL